MNSAGPLTFVPGISDGPSGTSFRGSLIVNSSLTTGTVTLSGANSYSGSTIVKAGTLALAGNGTLTSKDIQIGSNGGPILPGLYPGPAAVFQLDTHLERFFQSAAVYEIEIPYSMQQLADATLDVVRTNKLENAYLRPIAFFDASTLSVWTKECPVSVAIAGCGEAPFRPCRRNRHRRRGATLGGD